MDFIIDCILRFGVMIDEERLKSYLKRGKTVYIYTQMAVCIQIYQQDILNNT